EKLHAERTSQGKRAVRRRPATLQALLRKGRRADGSPSPRVLRKADAGTQAQAGRGGEAPREEAGARTGPAHSPLLIHLLFVLLAPGSRKRVRCFAFQKRKNHGAQATDSR